MFDLGIRSIWASKRVEHDHPLLTVIFRCGCWEEFFQYPDGNSRDEWSPVWIRNGEPASGAGAGPDCRVHLLYSLFPDDLWQVA